MKKILSLLIITLLSVSLIGSIASAGRFGSVIEETLSGWEWELPGWNTVLDFQEKWLISEIWWVEGIRDLLVTIWVQILIPVFVFTGIIIAILWFYKLMTSDSEEETNKSWTYIVYGTIWVVIMVSAWYIANLLVWVDGSWWAGSIFDFEWRSEFDGPELAAQLYNTIAYPFLRIFLNIAMGIMFVILLINALRLIFSPDDNIVSKASWIIVYSILGILAILLSKNIVEFVYGKYDSVVVDLVWGWDGELGKVGKLFWWLGWEWWASIGGDVMARFFWVINRVLGLATFIVTVIIIYLWYMLLIKPNDEESIAKIKRYLVYVIIGIFIIWFSYLLSRMVIITG